MNEGPVTFREFERLEDRVDEHADDIKHLRIELGNLKVSVAADHTRLFMLSALIGAAVATVFSTVGGLVLWLIQRSH